MAERKPGVTPSSPAEGGSPSGGSPTPKHAPVKETPLPWGQLAILCVVLLTESICSTVLIPFTPIFVAFLQGWEVSKSGFVAGFPVGLFMLGQVLSGKMWSNVSDKVGRVLGINFGVTGCAICMFFFGLSGSVWMMCFWRFIHGLVAGCSIIAKTMINDLTDSTNRAKGLALVSLTWGVGTLFGPAIGGFFYNPVENLGFPKGGFFEKYPAFLPSLIVAGYNAFAVVVSSFFLHESNKAARPLREVLPPTMVKYLGPVIRLIQPKLPCDEAAEVTITAETVSVEPCASGKEAPAASPGSAPPVNAPAPHTSFGFKQALANPLLRRVLIISMLISCSDMTFAQIFPLWCAAPTINGGLNLLPTTIAKLVLVNSVPAVAANIVFARTIQLAGGPIVLWEISQVLYGALTCIMPLATRISSSASPSAAFYYTMAVGMARKVVECWSFGLIMLVVSMTAPPGRVGMMFGIQQSTACIVRCVVPFVFAPLFAWSISDNHVFPLNYWLTFLLCLIPLAISAYMSHFIYIPSEDGNDEEGDEVDSAEAVDNAERRSDARNSGRGSVRSRYSFFGTVPGDTQERESLLLNNSFANLANSFATNIISGMPQNTILAVPIGAPLQAAGEDAEGGAGLLGGRARRSGGGDSRDASSQEGDEVDDDDEYASVGAEMATMPVTTAANVREGEDRRMTQRGNLSEDDELPV